MGEEVMNDYERGLYIGTAVWICFACGKYIFGG
jgi:hypothetical protein